MVTRRFVLGGVFAVACAPALAGVRLHSVDPYAHGISVDVSPLRARGDYIDADYLEHVLPAMLRQTFGPGRSVAVRIDDVVYGTPGSDGNPHNTGAVDTIQGVGVSGGRETPLLCSIQASVFLPDIGGYQGRERMQQLALSFAQWLPRQMGL